MAKTWMGRHSERSVIYKPENEASPEKELARTLILVCPLQECELIYFSCLYYCVMASQAAQNEGSKLNHRKEKAFSFNHFLDICFLQNNRLNIKNWTNSRMQHVAINDRLCLCTWQCMLLCSALGHQELALGAQTLQIIIALHETMTPCIPTPTLALP